ncbi:MAG TPA: hypothetical protein DCY07_07710 [Rhodospirillaceae bacterium]|nr:hypothetical protein [Rhodospirillaceae bacterium]
MNKKHLYIASALLSVMLLGSVANAQTGSAPAGTTAKATEMTGHKMAKPGMSKMSEAGQKMMREMMATVHEGNKESFEQIKAKREEMNALIKAEPFDKAAFVAKHEEIQQLHQKTMAARVEAKAAMIEKLSPEDRAAMADMPRHGRMGMKGGMGMGKGGMGMGGDCPMMGEDDMDDKAPAKK